jgi:hypothetical protein
MKCAKENNVTLRHQVGVMCAVHVIYIYIFFAVVFDLLNVQDSHWSHPHICHTLLPCHRELRFRRDTGMPRLKGKKLNLVMRYCIAITSGCQTVRRKSSLAQRHAVGHCTIAFCSSGMTWPLPVSRTSVRNSLFAPSHTPIHTPSPSPTCIRRIWARGRHCS